MSEVVERAVAAFLGSDEIDWNKMKPVLCFVVLWNRIEAEHGQHSNLNKLEASARSVITYPSFDITRYEKHVTYFQDRYKNSHDRLLSLLRNGGEPLVRQRVEDLVNDRLTGELEILSAVLMIPYRIRNNLFHGRKDTFELYSQTDLFTHVNEVLCLFHADLNGG